MLATDVITKARVAINDVSPVRWQDPELIGWLGEGQRAIARRHPRLAAKSAAMALAQSNVRQIIPSDGFAILDVEQNMGSDGLTQGAYIRQADFATLALFDPDMYTAGGSTTILHWSPDPDEDTRRFLVYPVPSTATVYVRITYAELYPDPTHVYATLPLDVRWEEPLVDYVVARALAKDAEEADNAKSEMHYKAFLTALDGYPG